MGRPVSLDNVTQRLDQRVTQDSSSILILQSDRDESSDLKHAKTFNAKASTPNRPKLSRSWWHETGKAAAFSRV
jgi:hypothetical protein